MSVTVFMGTLPLSAWKNLHLLPYVHFLPYGQGWAEPGAAPTAGEAGTRRKVSRVGPLLPRGSSGGMNLQNTRHEVLINFNSSFCHLSSTKVYIRILFSMTSLNSFLSLISSR